MPTRAVCDVYDQLRRDVITLLSLKKAAAKATEELEALRQNPTGADQGSAALSAAGFAQPTSARGGGSGGGAGAAKGGGGQKRKAPTYTPKGAGGHKGAAKKFKK